MDTTLRAKFDAFMDYVPERVRFDQELASGWTYYINTPSSREGGICTTRSVQQVLDILGLHEATSCLISP